MALSFGTSVAINNLLALKAFYTFLFNYQLHETPSWLERKFILPRLRNWVADKACSTMAELVLDESAKSASVTLNDVPGDFFAVLYCVQNPKELVGITEGAQLFILLANMSLEFEKIKKPRPSIQHEPRS